ncbi:alpha/beta hydrolase family esterase, partial [Nocardia neocaledoniensis]|uniref:alpha/beta hydrolase family esterase n=1 Tax=Nocardia neocaledoniensis TaxID=236511 RepID=UPI002453C992
PPPHARARTNPPPRAGRLRVGAGVGGLRHGSNQTGAGARRFTRGAFDRFSADGAAVVVYPDAVRREWNGARSATMAFKIVKTVDDVGFLSALIEDCRDRFGIGEVYVVGFSLGGQMVIRLLHDQPQALTAAAIISADLPTSPNRVVSDQPAVPVPLVLVHGTDDPLAPYTGGHVGFHGHFSKGEHHSAVDTAAYFAARNGITAAPITERTHRGDARTAITRTAHLQPDRAPVTLFTVHGGRHEIPGASRPPRIPFARTPPQFDTPRELAQFFGLPYPAPSAS